ncbi:MAG: RsmE family RNA methyltransferase [Candidatus Absconditabacterales bacterium]
MQLFITDQYTIQNNTITIRDERVLYQCTKVLRYKSGDQILLQDKGVRYTITLQSRDKTSLQGMIDATQAQPQNIEEKTSLIIAMTNKRDKMELICQKATEIGIHNIIIRKAKRSVIQVISDAKVERLQTICLEAAEQSFNRNAPSISICNKIQDLPQSYVAYQEGADHETITQNSKLITHNLLVGPEGGFDPSELSYFSEQQFPMVCFGETVLRTETAAIIGAWWLKNTLR